MESFNQVYNLHKQTNEKFNQINGIIQNTELWTQKQNLSIGLEEGEEKVTYFGISGVDSSLQKYIENVTIYVVSTIQEINDER